MRRLPQRHTGRSGTARVPLPIETRAAFEAFAAMSDAARRSRGAVDVERRARLPDGRTILARLRSPPVDASHTRDAGTIWVAADITERRRAALDPAAATNRPCRTPPVASRLIGARSAGGPHLRSGGNPSTRSHDPAHQRCQCARRLALALPDPLHMPAQHSQGARLRPVSLSIPGDLVAPERRIGLGLNAPVLARVPVPEATVHEDDRSPSRKDDVRCPGKGPHVDSEAQASAVKVATDRDFRRGILAAHALHQRRARAVESGGRVT